MSYTLKVLKPPKQGDPENPLMRTEHTYTYYNDVNIPDVTYKTEESGEKTATVIWGIGTSNGYMCINIPIVAYLMENGVTIDTIKPD